MMLTLNTMVAQNLEVGFGLVSNSYTRDDVKVVDGVEIYNFAARQSGGDQLPDMALESKNILAMTLFAKYRLENVPLTAGLEILLRGFNVAAFAEYDLPLHDGEISVFARPRVSIGWNSKFPVRPNWKEFLSRELPDLTAAEIEEGAALFDKVSPSSIGTALSVQLAPQIDLEWYPPLGLDFLLLRGSLRYQWDLMTLLSSRSQNSVFISVAAVTQFGG
ncbi:MAG: hypothetical protein H6765_00905 [Candidatus Peribacteria bacterium]|nr:MAG: hypothetical protein H6765_00905 [Candidatus Peribacteria bacterium]